MFMKASSKVVNAMEGGHFGGQTEVGMKEGSKKVCSRAKEFSIELIKKNSIRVNG